MTFKIGDPILIIEETHNVNLPRYIYAVVEKITDDFLIYFPVKNSNLLIKCKSNSYLKILPWDTESNFLSKGAKDIALEYVV